RRQAIIRNEGTGEVNVRKYEGDRAGGEVIDAFGPADADVADAQVFRHVRTRAAGGDSGGGPGGRQVVVSRIEPGQTEPTQYELDAEGRPRTAADPIDRVTHRQFDPLGRPVTSV